MTISETILSFPGLENCASFLEKVLVDRSLTGADNYTKEVQTQVNLAAADMYFFVVNSYDFTENKLSITYPRSYMQKTASNLYNQNGEPENANIANGRFKVSGRSVSKW